MLVFRRLHQKILPSPGGGGIALDWRHPLTNGLIGCWIPGISLGVNLASVNCADLVFTGSSFDDKADGPALGLLASASSLEALAPPPFKSFPAGGSCFWRGNFTGATTNYSTLIGITYDNAGNVPFSVLTVHRRTGGNAIKAQTNDNGNLIETADWDATSQGTNPFSTAGTFGVGTGSVLRLYGNGVLQVSVAGPVLAPVGTATSTVGFAVSLLGVPTSLTYSHVGYIWNRQLSADEMAWIDAEPYSFLIPAEGEMPELSPAAAPTVFGSTFTLMGVG